MTDIAGAQVAPATPTTIPTPATVAAAQSPAPAPETPAGKPAEGVPEWVQKELKEARAEAAKYRVEAKEAAEKVATDLRTSFAKALGIETGEQLTPEQLAEKSQTRAESAETRAATAERSLAIHKAAAAAGANADALLDSNTFLAKVSQLDPTSADFGAQVGQAITAAVAANPTLKVTQAAAVGGAEITGGTGEQRTFTMSQISDFAYYKAHKAEIEAALKAGRIIS